MTPNNQEITYQGSSRIPALQKRKENIRFIVEPFRKNAGTPPEHRIPARDKTGIRGWP